MFTPSAGFTDGTIVMPPDSAVVAPVSVRSSSGIRPGPCSLIDGTLYASDGRPWCPGWTYSGGCFIMVCQCSDGES